MAIFARGSFRTRAPHITLKSIADNAEIDVIWDEFQAKLNRYAAS